MLRAVSPRECRGFWMEAAESENRSAGNLATDVYDPEKRSKDMSAVRSKNTKPELIVRSGLHLLGYRFRLRRKDLPGRPDIVLQKYKTVVFVHGCFWHRHARLGGLAGSGGAPVA